MQLDIATIVVQSVVRMLLIMGVICVPLIVLAAVLFVAVKIKGRQEARLIKEALQECGLE